MSARIIRLLAIGGPRGLPRARIWHELGRDAYLGAGYMMRIEQDRDEVGEPLPLLCCIWRRSGGEDVLRGHLTALSASLWDGIRVIPRAYDEQGARVLLELVDESRRGRGGATA